MLACSLLQVVEECQAALLLKPHHMKSVWRVAEAYFQTGNSERALYEIERAVAADNSNQDIANAVENYRAHVYAEMKLREPREPADNCGSLLFEALTDRIRPVNEGPSYSHDARVMHKNRVICFGGALVTHRCNSCTRVESMSNETWGM